MKSSRQQVHINTNNTTEFNGLMDKPQNIRNISIVSQIDFGTTTTINLLNRHYGIRFPLNKKTKLNRFRSTSRALYFNRSRLYDNENYLINIIRSDSSRYSEFSSETNASFKITDGVLVIIDCIEGVSVQMERILAPSISNLLRPILFLNKLDRVFMELNSSLEEIYNMLRNSIQAYNVITNTYMNNRMGSIECHPNQNNIAFGSSLYEYGFTLNHFTAMYSCRFGLSKRSLCKRFWGNNYYNPKMRRWVKKNDGTLTRSFNQFILYPLKVLTDSILNEKHDIYIPIIETFNIGFVAGTNEYNKYINLIINGYIRRVNKLISNVIPDVINKICSYYYCQLKSVIHFEEIKKPKRVKDLLKLIMSAWLPLNKTLMNMIVDNLPSPIIAQPYRTSVIYSSPNSVVNTETNYIRNCDVNGIMTMCVVKMLPTAAKGQFIAFGRVFSGIIKRGQQVNIMGPDYKYGKKKDLIVSKIQKLLIITNDNHSKEIDQVSAGNVCGVIGIDQYLLKYGTLTTSLSMYPFNIPLAVYPEEMGLIKISITPKNARDLPIFVKAVKYLEKIDYVKCVTSINGEYVVEFNNNVQQLQCNMILKEWKDNQAKKIDIIQSKPITKYYETIINTTGCDDRYPKVISTKSPNKHSRLFMNAQPLTSKFIEGIEDNDINTNVNSLSIDDMKTFTHCLSNKYDWDINESRHIWTFGYSPDAVANCIVDMTKGAAATHMHASKPELKDRIISTFALTTQNGILCNENMRGIRFNVTNIMNHSDAIHRGGGQIIPMARKAFYACQIGSSPKLVEPMYLVDIYTPTSSGYSGVFQTLSVRRGEIQKIGEKIGTPLSTIQAYLPVAESYGFTDLLRKNTGGQAFPQFKFSHWKLVGGDPFEENTDSYNILMDIRKRKGLKLVLPKFNDYFDKV